MNPTPKPFRGGFGPILKLALIAFLTLLLLIPLQLIRSVLAERRGRQAEAVQGITSTWGAPQVLFGPVLTVPYRTKVRTWKETLVDGHTQRVQVTDEIVAFASFLPDELKVTGDLKPDTLHRGIYEAVVYRGALKIAGAFARPSFETWKVDPNAILWDDATLSLAITDLRGTQGTLTVRWAEQSLPLEPGCRIRGFDSGVSARIPGLEAAAGPLMFDLDLNLKGSFSLGLIPAGRTTEARLKSEWPDPRFDGAFLPAERTVTPDGFQARWEVSYYGRMFPQRWSTADGESRFDPNQATASAFRVSLLSVVDAYRLTERSIKYGVLFLVLVFTTFFLFEAIASLRVHPVQYALVGAALCLFYLILLSLSEFIRFSAAYALAALAATGLIAAYCARVLHKRSRAVLLGAGLLGTYGCLYVILQMQDYSLLLGTAGLFLALGLVMFLTRNLDWYGQPGDEPPAPPTPDCTSQAP